MSPRHPATVTESRRLRRDATPAERAFWRAIRGNALGIRVRRQHPIGRYIADFVCVEAKLVIEIDGGQHSPERDAERDTALRSAGWEVVRYWNNDVLGNVEGVVMHLRQVLAKMMVDGSPPP